MKSLLWGRFPSICCPESFLPSSPHLHLKPWHQSKTLLSCYYSLQCWAMTFVLHRRKFLSFSHIFPQCHILPAELILEGEGSCEFNLACWTWRFKYCKYPVSRPKVQFQILSNIKFLKYKKEKTKSQKWACNYVCLKTRLFETGRFQGWYFRINKFELSAHVFFFYLKDPQISSGPQEHFLLTNAKLFAGWEIFLPGILQMMSQLIWDSANLPD